jgi:hypothetical protein
MDFNEHDSRDDSALESAAADNELVKFVNKVIIDAHSQKVFDIHIVMPGKAKTGISLWITQHPAVHIEEVPAHFAVHGHTAQDHVWTWTLKTQATRRQDQIQKNTAHSTSNRASRQFPLFRRC